MAITDLNKILSKSILNDDVLLFGVEEYNVESDLNKLLKKFYPNTENDYNFYTIDSDEQGLSEFLDIASSFPMLGDRVTIVCKNFHNYFDDKTKKGKKNKERIKNYYYDPSPTTRIIACAVQDKFSRVKINKIPEPYKSISAKADTIFYPKVWPDKYHNWIRNKFSENGIKTRDDVVRVILSQTPDNLRDIGNQIEKIVTFLGEEKELNENKIFKIIGNNRKYNVFELQKQVIKRDLNQALYIAQNIYTNSKTDLSRICATLSIFFKNLLKYIELNPAQRSNKFDVAKLIGVSPMFVNDYQLATKNYRPKDLEKIFILLSETDYKLKSSGENSLILINKLLIEVISK